MTQRDFIFWIQGYFELTGTKPLTKKQVEVIRGHLDLVFRHEFGAKAPEVEAPKEECPAEKKPSLGELLTGRTQTGVRWDSPGGGVLIC